MIIDLHSHYFPIEAFQKIGKHHDKAPKINFEGDKLTVSSGGGTRGGLGAPAYDAVARVKTLDTMRIDLQAISPSPIMLFYWEEAEAAAYFSRAQNVAIGEIAKQYPDRILGFGSVPLQNIPDAIAIAEEAKAVGLKGLEIGTAVGGRPLDDPMFEPFYDAIEALELLLFVHPLEDGIDAEDPLTGMLGNVAFFPFRTTVMIERMILKGLFEKYKNLRLCLAHGGGLLAFNIWRLDHAYSVRPAFRRNIPRRPSEYLKTLYFDSIVHSVASLQYLIQTVGADRVVVGTDFPMAMGDFEPVQKIAQLNLTGAERELILGGNAARVLNL